jgi:hypothetical protein
MKLRYMHNADRRYSLASLVAEKDSCPPKLVGASLCEPMDRPVRMEAFKAEAVSQRLCVNLG